MVEVGQIYHILNDYGYKPSLYKIIDILSKEDVLIRNITNINEFKTTYNAISIHLTLSPKAMVIIYG